MKKIIGFLFLAFYLNLYSQNQNYLDSLSKQLNQLPKREQVKTIIKIPYDKAVGNIILFERLADSAIAYSLSINDTLLLADAYDKKLLALHFTSRSEEAVQLMFKTIKLRETLGDSLKLGLNYTNLGWTLKYKDLDKAFNYMKFGLSIAKDSIHSSNLHSAYDNFGVLYGMKKQWDSAKYYHKKVLKFRKETKDSVGIPFAYSHLANVYLNTEQFNLAERYLDSALSIRKARKDTYGITDSELYLGDLFYAQGLYRKAIQSFKNAYDLAEKHKYYPLKKYASEYLYKSNKAINNFEEALHYNQIFNTLKDSINNVETNSRIAKLDIEFQTERKERQIALQRADIAEQELSINKKNSYIWGLSILAIAILVIGYLLYTQQKLKNRQLKKQNELETALVKIETQNKLQDQRLRISRDLHDNIGAQLTFIISSLDNLKYSFKIPKKLDSKLSSISAFTNSTIFELRDTIWAMNKSEVSMEDLKIRVINYLAKAEKASHETDFQFEVSPAVNSDVMFSSVVGMNIYRIIQEAVHNAIKYADASTVSIYASKKEEQLTIEVKDNGKGFQIDKVERGNGLNNMKKRADEIGADFNISSKTNGGTQINLRLKNTTYAV